MALERGRKPMFSLRTLFEVCVAGGVAWRSPDLSSVLRALPISLSSLGRRAGPLPLGEALTPYYSHCGKSMFPQNCRDFLRPHGCTYLLCIQLA